jgi:hypothetical protein
LSLPEKHLDWLREGVATHLQRLDQLREVIRRAEEEVAFEELLLDFVQNGQLLEALGELYDDAYLTSRVARDPLGYCREKDISLPEGVTLSAVEREGRAPRLVAHLRQGSWAMEVGWDRKAGFFASPPEEPAENLSALNISSIEVSSE